MKVVLKVHEDIAFEYQRWRRSLARNLRESAALADRYWTEFEAYIQSAGGQPPKGSYPHKEMPDAFWCSFPPAYIAAVVRKRIRRKWIFWKVAEMIVIELNFSPGLPR